MKSDLTKEIELYLLLHYRFKKSYLICNEVSLKYGICDLFAIKQSKKKFTSYEFEIKISKSDFKYELAKDKKHKYYLSGVTAPNKPNYFYFVTIPELKDFALEFINGLNKNYGLIVYNNKNIEIIKKPKKLCKIGNCDTILLYNLLSRSTSAYCNLRGVINGNKLYK